MSFNLVLTAFFLAAAFVGWPIVGKYTGASSSWINMVVITGTMFVIAALSSRSLMSTSVPSLKALILLGIAAIANGFAVHFYAAKAADPAIPTATFVVIVAVLMVVWAPILDWALNGTVPVPRQLAGYAGAAISIYLLGK